MNLPQPGDYIDMHTHSSKPASGVFIIECLMAHEDRFPDQAAGLAYTYGIHPWFLTEDNHNQHISNVEKSTGFPNMIAIGEAGFDKLRGPSPELQSKVFEEQALISETHMKPLIIHCVKAWDDLLAAHKKLKPKMPWMIHGFRGSIEQAEQLLSKGFYLSFWFDFALRKESTQLFRSLPKNRIFLETDGADVDIRDIYKKVAGDLDMTVDELNKKIQMNFNEFFNLNFLPPNPLKGA
jgi:TatD DNase family protein